MPAGTKVGIVGNVLPLQGETTMLQETAATDILTIKGVSGQTGAYISGVTSGDVQRFSINASGNLVNVVSGTAADVLFKGTQAGSASGDAVQIVNSSGSKVFQVNSSGAVRTMVLGTTAIGALASNASTSFSSAGISTDDAIMLIPLKTLTTGLGLVQAFAQGTTRIDVYAAGGSAASNTYAVWAIRTAAN